MFPGDACIPADVGSVEDGATTAIAGGVSQVSNPSAIR